MWFSSGGTKSVVHTDAVDNILCLFRGEKVFVMVDPEKYVDRVCTSVLSEFMNYVIDGSVQFLRY